MRTVLFLAAGFVLLGVTVLLSRAFTENVPSAPSWGIAAFLVLWFAITAFNMWVGVTRAGYSATEELPILLLLFGLPAAVALVLKWKFL